MARRQHTPLRTCIVCGRKTEKRELVRVVAKPDGSVTIDLTGKSQGRGAYMCGEDLSTPQSLKRGRLEHALRTKLTESDWAGIHDSFQHVTKIRSAQQDE